MVDMNRKIKRKLNVLVILTPRDNYDYHFDLCMHKGIHNT